MELACESSFGWALRMELQCYGNGNGPMAAGTGRYPRNARPLQAVTSVCMLGSAPMSWSAFRFFHRLALPGLRALPCLVRLTGDFTICSQFRFNVLESRIRDWLLCNKHMILEAQAKPKPCRARLITNNVNYKSKMPSSHVDNPIQAIPQAASIVNSFHPFHKCILSNAVCHAF